MSYETIILEKLEKLKQVCLDVDEKEANVFVRCDPFFSLVSDDGYNEIDFLFSLMIEPGIERKVVLMFTRVTDGEREFIRELDDEDAWKRARKYCASLGKDNYYGLSNSLEVIVRSLDPAVRFESKVRFEEFSSLLLDIISEERRIKDSVQFTQALKDYFGELQPHVHSSLSVLLKDEEFRKSLARFLEPIGMAPEDEELLPETVSMISQQATYLLLDKILFLALLNESKDQLLPKLLKREDKDYIKIFEQLAEPLPEIVDDKPREWTAGFWDALEEKFRLIRLIDYEPIFDPKASPLNEVSLRGDLSGCLVLRDILAFLHGKERLTKLFDGPLLSRIYEGLIPPELRWKWGQIYTPPEVTRLITHWAIRNPSDTVLDPACGTGRFLTSSYRRLRALKKEKSPDQIHQEIINQIYGIDINQFPAHLATMSLVAEDFTSVTDIVNIRVADFFRYLRGEQATFFDEETRVKLTGQSRIGTTGRLGGQSRLNKVLSRPVPGVDALAMNPPYTRRKALDRKYINFVRKVSLSGVSKNRINMSGLAGYYVYFIIHATKFLKKDGLFGVLTTNSWLDVKYGKDVQKFLLDNYKIKAIIGSSKERLIKTADVNTVITLLKRALGENKKEERDTNRVKLVNLKRELTWFESNYGFDTLLGIIDEKDEYASQDLRVISRTQKELLEESLVGKTYVGGKWGRFLRAPDVFFEKIEKILNKRIEDFADVSLGLTSGYNPFFYLKDDIIKEKAIEPEYLFPLVKSPRECKKYKINPEDLNYKVLYVKEDRNQLKNKHVLEYIEEGERQGIPDRPFFENKNKEAWFKLQMINAPLLQPYDVNVRHFTCFNDCQFCVDKRLVCIKPERNKLELIWGYLNSTLGILIKELFGRVSLGQGALDNSVTDVELFPIFDLENLEKIGKDTQKEIEEVMHDMLDREIETVFEELDANTPDDVSLDRIKPDRRRLDSMIMGTILGLSRREQLEIYRSVVELVKSRIEKGKIGEKA